MGCPRLILASVLLLSLSWGISAQDCVDGETVYKDQKAFLTKECNKAFLCHTGTVYEVAAVWRCPTNAHCEDGVCVCDAKFETSGRNGVGLLSGCKRVDFSCDYEGARLEDRKAFLSKECNKAYQCQTGTVNEVAAVWKCPTSSHCEDGVCVCDAKFETSRRNSGGLLSGCKRVDFSCDYEGSRIEHDTTWLTQDCSKKLRCSNGRLLTFSSSYKCFSNSHCENGECVCNDNYKLVVTEKYSYCERTNFDCTYDGKVLKDRSSMRTADCSKLVECFFGKIKVTETPCAIYMHCENATCQCDEKYRPSRVRSDGLILGCSRYDFSCEQDGVKRDEGTYWLSEDCSKAYRCSRGNINEEKYECPTLSHCENRMCYCDEGFKESAVLSTGQLFSCRRQRYDVNCTSYFYELFGMCLRGLSGEKDYAQSVALCQSRGAELMVADRLYLRFKQLSTRSLYQGQRYFLGGSSIFDDISALPDTDETKADRRFISDMIQAHNVPEDQAVAAFRRFSPKATVADLNAATPLSSLCLAYDFSLNAISGLVLVDCHDKIGAICQEETTVKDRETTLTEWYDVDKNADDGSQESLNGVADAYKKGVLPNARLCRTPVEMQCREIGTDKLYTPSNTHGYVLRKACESLTIECNNEDQPNGKKCPDFEIRFKCNVDPSTDCAVDATRSFCESRGKECVMGLYGAGCITRRSRRTGYERIGVGRCTIDSLNYNVFSCSAQGPRVTTFDTKKYDFHGKCSYTLVSTKDDYRPTRTFPAFRIVKNNVVDPDGDINVVAFDLTINSVTYSFNGDSFFRQDSTATTVQANPVGYSDDHILITAQSGGRYVKYQIDTNFCLTILFDNENGLQISLPHSYKIRILGMCGNYDGSDQNDIRLPYERDNTTPEVLGDYYLVGGGANKGKCVDGMVIPEECDHSAINRSKDKKHCGIFDSTRGSPLVSAILDLSVDQVKDYNRIQLNKLYQNCIKRSCKNHTESFRCRSLDESINRLVINLNLDESDFNSQWREYVQCENMTSSMCDNNPYTVFQEKYKPNCQDSCFERDRSAQCEDEMEWPGCACMDGYYLDARRKCVPAAECQKTCRADLSGGERMELNNGDTFVIKPCSSLITCEDGKIVDGQMGPCSEYAECVNYGRQCACRQGYEGDGITCVSKRKCRDGYIAMGNKCYKLVLRKLDWHTAAITCGVDGSQLARYDSPMDEDLAFVLHKVPQMYLQSMASRVRRRCYSGRKCLAARNAFITSVEVAYKREKADCENNYRISADRKFVIVTGKCQARFIIGYVDYNYAKSLKVEDFDVWIGGNTHVLGQWNQNGKSYFQVDPPKLVDPVSFGNEMGCYKAKLNGRGNLLVKPVPDCDLLKVSMCEYDNTKKNNYDPNDFKGIDQEVIYQKAIELCEAEDRPLATVTNENQAEKIRGILSTLGGSGWLGARYTQSTGQFLWLGNQAVLFHKWDSSEPDNYDVEGAASNLVEHCVSVNKRTGKWSSSECTRKFYPICGPPEGNKPSVFTSFFPVSEPSSLSDLKETIRKSGIKDYICSQPVAIECTAREIANGPWVTAENDKSGSIKCEMSNFSCEDTGALDCSTFQIRFLCPADDNHCQSLKDLGVTPCDQQRMCVHVRNHYACRCPPGRKWNKYSKECTKPCGECQARGDPHYITLGGQNFDFQGQCKYKLSGICDADRDQSSPSFDINTWNIACGARGAACLKSIEIKLFNMPIQTNGVEEKVDYVISIPGRTSDYKINNADFKQNQYSVHPAFSIVRRFDYFYFESSILDITLLFSGHAIKVTIPDKFHDKMCGLCGQCGTDELQFRNGTKVTLQANKRGRIKSEDVISFANNWLETDPTLNSTECKNVDFEDCPEDKLEELAKPDKCGIFLEKSGSLKDCFNVVDPNVYFEDCKFDACLENHEQAICDMIKTYAQACSQKGVTLDWRREDFCAYPCTDEKQYRVDASCAPTCGQSAATRELCDEDPEEGCICPRGQMRLGDKCVQPDQCGCVLLLNSGTKEWLLPPGETILMPECQTKVTCEINDQGAAIPVSEPFSLDANAICVPGIPPRIECRKGYILADDGVTCIEDPESCKGNYQDRAGMCIEPQPEERIWRQGIEACNEKDGTFVKVDDELELEEIAKVIEENIFDSVFISGQVKAAIDESNKLTFKPVLTEEEQGKIEYYNFDFKKFLLPLISLSSQVDKSTVKNGDVFALLVTVDDDDKFSVAAVPRDTKSNFICEERKPKDNETDWFGPCNTDSYMADDGDRETRISLMMDPDCLVCSRPKDVRCEAVNASKGSVNGTCQMTSTGTYYYCNEGSGCIDNSVSLKCTKDIDECAEGFDDCSDRMICSNTVGAYRCKCKEGYPIMVDGKCESETTCTMSGPETPNSYVYDLRGFSNSSAVFDYDCPFLLASVCEDSYDNSVPFVAFYVMSTRKSGALNTHFAGAIYDPRSKEAIVWSLTPESLTKATIKIGADMNSMVDATIGFSVRNLQTQFSFFYPNGIIIKHINNYFKLIISLPNKVQVTFSESYKDMTCGLCAIDPAKDGGSIVLTKEQEEEISIPYTKSCTKKGPSDNTTITTTPAVPMTTTITTVSAPTTQPGDLIPTTTPGPLYPYCDLELLEVCQWLSRLCQISKTECSNILCSGTVGVCEYLREGNFDSCIMDKSMTIFTESIVDCDEDCGINMKFQYTTKYNQPSCSLPYGVTDESFSSDYGFTCICVDDFIFSGNECVRTQNCGCTMEDGIYRPRGTIWRPEGCGQINTCLGDDKISEDPRPCGPNTECVSTEDGYACKCSEDYYGDPDMISGCKEAEVEDDGTKVCTTIVEDGGSVKKECTCKMGFRSNCESCEDIDECKEGLNDCDKRNEKCVNKPGSYECDCADGFTAQKGVCVDVDECQNNTSICEDNEGCINEVGTFRCDCCVGYRHNPETETCEPDTAVLANLPEDVHCCVECPNPVLCDESDNNPVPYCYMVKEGYGNEYPSFKALYRAFCINNNYLDKSKISRGPCPTNTTPIPTGGPPSTGGNPNGPRPTSCDSPSLCSYFPPPPPPLQSGPVCGPSNVKDPITFPSYCALLRAVCKAVGGPKNVPIQSPIDAKKGPCESGGGPGDGYPNPIPTGPPSEPLFTNWSPFSSCSPYDKAAQCGQGVQVRDRDVVPYDDLRPVRIVEDYDIEETRVCYIPCDPKNTTGNFDLCPDVGICSERFPVCGYVGAQEVRTFNSECEMNVTACQEGQTPVKLKEGECDPDNDNKNRRCEIDGPIVRTEKFEKRTGNEHCVGREVSVGTCTNLLCDGRLDNCCRAKEEMPISFDINCYDTADAYKLTRTETRMIYSAISCHCDSNSEDNNKK